MSVATRFSLSNDPLLLQPSVLHKDLYPRGCSFFNVLQLPRETNFLSLSIDQRSIFRFSSLFNEFYEKLPSDLSKGILCCLTKCSMRGLVKFIYMYRISYLLGEKKCLSRYKTEHRYKTDTDMSIA